MLRKLCSSNAARNSCDSPTLPTLPASPYALSTSSALQLVPKSQRVQDRCSGNDGRVEWLVCFVGDEAETGVPNSRFYPRPSVHSFCPSFRLSFSRCVQETGVVYRSRRKVDDQDEVYLCHVSTCRLTNRNRASRTNSLFAASCAAQVLHYAPSMSQEADWPMYLARGRRERVRSKSEWRSGRRQWLKDWWCREFQLCNVNSRISYMGLHKRSVL